MTSSDTASMEHSQSQQEQHNTHHYPTRHATSSYSSAAPDGPYNSPVKKMGSAHMEAGPSGSHHSTPSTPPPKQVSFELLLDENSKTRARIPMRVFINPHDATNDIVATVKNFYGLYEQGVSFQDKKGNTLIASYENVQADMVVYIRVVPGHPYPQQQYGQSAFFESSPVEMQSRPSLGEPFQMAPPQPAQILDYGQPPSRPVSRIARKRSVSPQSGRGRRSVSLQKAGSRSGAKTRESSAHGSFHDYSDSEGGRGSVTSSMRARGEQFVSAEISLGNIVQEERRKRPRFESSELPLYVPPQMPLTASTSSISPQRRSMGQEGPSPFARPTQRTFSYQPQPLPSPQRYGHPDQPLGFSPHYNGTSSTPGAPQHGHRLRERSYIQPVGRTSIGRGGTHNQGIPLPTPDPTIASCISDEDVARQLIALGDVSNISHGRISASTMDDAFSGAADAASSVGVTSDSEEDSEDEADFPPRSKRKLDSIILAPESSEPSYDEIDGDYYEIERDIKSEHDEYKFNFERDLKQKKSIIKGPVVLTSKNRSLKASSTQQNKVTKARPHGTSKKPKTNSTTDGSNGANNSDDSPGQPRKTSSASTLNFQHQLAADEEDLSSKPRCQRCRKSKKGCDRQRPCQRCKDAGIGIEGCMSEDEGNGRKGRYGRHMGVSVKKEADNLDDATDFQTAGAILTGMAGGQGSPDKTKKRKR